MGCCSCCQLFLWLLTWVILHAYDAAGEAMNFDSGTGRRSSRRGRRNSNNPTNNNTSQSEPPPSSSSSVSSWRSRLRRHWDNASPDLDLRQELQRLQEEEERDLSHPTQQEQRFPV